MEFSLPKTRFHCQLFVAYLQMTHIISGLKVDYSDLGETVTRLAVHNTDVYVGGTNFIARLSSSMDLLFKLSIGPVTDPQHCTPSSRSCDNRVRILEIDTNHNMLLVCGSAYKGTCTLHSLPDISNWHCLYGDYLSASADVISGSYTQASTVHFLAPTKMNSNLTTASNISPHQCRSSEFGRHSTSNKSNTSFNRTESTMSSIDHKQSVSNLIVAGITINTDSTVNPLFLSLRQVIFSGAYYNVTYVRRLNNKPVGFELARGTEPTFPLDYKLSFTWEGFSYFISLQNSDCGTGSVKCVVAKISRICHQPTAFLPYVETILSCTHAGNIYRLLTSATLGTIGLQLASSYETVPVLLAAFGNGSSPSSTTADSKYGTAVCAFTLDYLDKVEFKLASDECAKGDPMEAIAKTVSWIHGSQQSCLNESVKNGACMSSTVNPHIESAYPNEMPALVYLRLQSVDSVLTHTITLDDINGQKNSPIETMDVYLLTNTGKVHKFSLKAKRHPASLNEYLVEQHTPLTEILDLKETILSSVGVTDHTRAFMYVGNGHNVMKVSLDSCLNVKTCVECREDNTCHWCSIEQRCFRIGIAENRCNSTENRCPPVLMEFKPMSVPTAGGSLLTIYGENLGSENFDIINVTVCDKQCDNAVAHYNNITCRLKENCPCDCYIQVQVNSKGSYGSASSSVLKHSLLKYVIPSFSSFSPNHGPAFGGTVLTFQGQNITSGSSTKIFVAGTICEIKSKDEYLTCRVTEDKQRKTHSGPVNISIDNFSTTLSESFSFVQNPTIGNMRPMRTIVSGGITVEVDGKFLNSVMAPLLKLTLPNRKPISSEASCLVTAEGQKMICKTPDLTSELNDINTTATNISVNVTFSMDGVDLLKTHHMTVHADPKFYFNETSEEAHIQWRTEPLILRGENIPKWINRSDIQVTIGNITLTIIDVKSHYISCNVSQIIDVYSSSKGKENFPTTTSKKMYTTTLRTSSTTTSKKMDTTTSRTSRVTTTSRTNRVTSATTLSTKGKTTPKTILNLTTASTKVNHIFTHKMSDTGVNNKNDSTPSALNDPRASVRQTSRTNPPLTTVRPSNHSTITKSTLPEKITELSLKITVRVGNYKKVLGNVAIGPKKAPVAAGLDFRLIGGAGGAGLVILALVIVSVVMYIRAQKANALIKDQAFYMSSLSGSQHGSKEAAQISLKQILQSIIEPSKGQDMDRLIISLDQLTVGKTIGSGNFGCVFEGVLSSDKEKEAQAQKVAVKTLQDPLLHYIDLHAFVQEALIMREFQHPHVLGLIGLAEKEPGIPYVILPYMDNGDLLTFIRDANVKLSLHDVIKFGADIASGMAYISALKFVHRDLAARNCMLDNQYRVKVADFGLCRDIYEKGYYTSNNKKKLPIRWMAVESIEQGAYSTKSDVWSFGVVLWELLSRGVTPYPGVNGWDIINFLRHRRLAPPFFCPDELYNLMMKCWAKDPNLRPDFDALPTELFLMIGQNPVVTDTMRKRRGDAIKKQDSMSNTGSKLKNESTDASGNKSNCIELLGAVNKGNPSNLNNERPYTNILSCSPATPLKNVMITIPACYSHRDVSRMAAGTYIKLVDNYEPAPKFANPLLRSLKKHSKKSSTHAAKKGRDSKADTSAYSFPGDILAVESSFGNAAKHDSEDQLQSSEENLAGRNPKEGPYYELEEPSMVSSANSENHSSAWSMLNMTGSSGSIPDYQSHFSSTSHSCSGSSTSRLSVPHNGRGPHNSAPGTLARKVSPLADPMRRSDHMQVEFNKNGMSERHSDLITSLKK